LDKFFWELAIKRVPPLARTADWPAGLRVWDCQNLVRATWPRLVLNWAYG
jgi:hypothetical protein